MIYCILGMVILFANSEANIAPFTATLPVPTTTKLTTQDSYPLLCDVFSESQVYCGLSVKQPAKFSTFYEIPRQVKYFDANSFVKGSWMIQSPTIFQPLTNLRKMRFVGLVELPPIQDSSPTKMEYVNRLFDFPNMRYLELRYWNLDDSNWKFPDKLETIILNRCEFTRLNLTLNKNLVTINVAANNLKKIPTLSDPPPPVETLILSSNANLEFTADDIVNLCNLKHLGLTTFNANLNKTAQFCECQRLKDYMKEFGISSYDIFTCGDGKETFNCVGYGIDELRSTRKSKCSKTETLVDKPVTVLPAFIPQDSWISKNALFLGVAVVLLISLFANLLLFGAMFSRRSAANSASPWESPAPEATYEEEGEL